MIISWLAAGCNCCGPHRRLLARMLSDQPKCRVAALAANAIEGPAAVEVLELGPVTRQMLQWLLAASFGASSP